LNYPLSFKHIKDQFAFVLKSRRSLLKKKIERVEDHLPNCSEAHWSQLKEVLQQEQTIETAQWMTKIRSCKRLVIGLDE
jgi:hypothetical protein